MRALEVELNMEENGTYYTWAKDSQFERIQKYLSNINLPVSLTAAFAKLSYDDLLDIPKFPTGNFTKLLGLSKTIILSVNIARLFKGKHCNMEELDAFAKLLTCCEERDLKLINECTKFYE